MRGQPLAIVNLRIIKYCFDIKSFDIYPKKIKEILHIFMTSLLMLFNSAISRA